MFGRMKRKKPDKEHDRSWLLDKTSDFIDLHTGEHQKACGDCNASEADKQHEDLKYFHNIMAILSKDAIKGHLKLRISSMYLLQIMDELVDGSGLERECYCTGIMDKETNTAIPTLIVPLELKEQSAVSAEAEVSSVYEALMEMDNWGHSLLLFCHCHPGCGASSITPSSTDMATHKDLETCYSTIGAIFSQDGFVRFFSHDKEFEVEIFGKGVKKVDDKVFQITR